MLTKRFLVLCLGALCVFTASGESTPTFERYAVQVEAIRSPRIDLGSHPIGRKYRTQIRYTVKTQGVNFGGHYTLVEWGCGSPCTQLAIVDLKSGDIWHDADVIAARGFVFHADSTLLVQDPWDGPGDFLPRVPTRFFTFSNGRLKLVAVVKHAG